MERRELERQRERERLIQEQRLAESAKQLQGPLIRDRSPLRSSDISEIRVKEEPRIKEEEMLVRTDPRYVSSNMFYYIFEKSLNAYCV